MAAIITTTGLTKYYGKRLGIQNVYLEVPEGQVFGFLGPNGAGKTTTIRILLGLVHATAGDAKIFGQSCWRASAQIKREVGYLPGDLRLYSWMTATSALAVFGQIRKKDLRAAGKELCERFGLEPRLLVRKMSKGMRQKLGLILALAHKPRLLILDEPTSGLDPLMQEQLASLLREWAGKGHTVFFSSHTLSEVEQLCDAVAIVREGRVVAHESLAALRARAGRTVTIFFDDPRQSQQLEPPPSLTVIRRTSVQWDCQLNGEAKQLVEWAAQQSIRDLEIGHPDLETVFRSFYRAARASGS